MKAIYCLLFLMALVTIGQCFNFANIPQINMTAANTAGVSAINSVDLVEQSVRLYLLWRERNPSKFFGASNMSVDFIRQKIKNESAQTSATKVNLTSVVRPRVMILQNCTVNCTRLVSNTINSLTQDSVFVPVKPLIALIIASTSSSTVVASTTTTVKPTVSTNTTTTVKSTANSTVSTTVSSTVKPSSTPSSSLSSTVSSTTSSATTTKTSTSTTRPPTAGK